MNLVLYYSSENNLKEEAINRVQIPIHEPLASTNEGNEFPGDALHFKHQPTIFTEECIAAGCPEGLW